MEGHKHRSNCKEVFAALSDYLDRELTAEDYEEIERHVEHCPPCIEFLESLKRSVKLCKNCAPAETPPPLTEREQMQLRAAYERAMAARRK